MKRELELLREKMRETGVDACLIPTSDFHGSEYVGDYFKCREYISGFTGSAGTLVVEVAQNLNQDQEVGLAQVLAVKQEVVLEQSQEVGMEKLQLNKMKKENDFVLFFHIYRLFS